MTAARQVLTGTMTVALPPERAFTMFTPTGERAWVPGWNPRFPAPGADETAPGTVFETTAHEHPERTTTWLVVDRTPARRVRYARVLPGDTAGTVTVELADAGGRSDVTVTYDLTALTDAAVGPLTEFAAGYAGMLRAWQAAIAAAVEQGTAIEH